MNDLTLSSTALIAAGGLLSGGAAAGLWATHGRIAGISGLLATTADPEAQDRGSRASFLIGLVATGLVAGMLRPDLTAVGTTVPMGAILVAGLAVGFGARLGSGCTSGHGVCGMGRMSRRSMVAMGCFMAVGALSLLVTRAVLGGAA